MAAYPTLNPPISVGSFLRETMVLMPALNEAPCVGRTVKGWLDLGVGRVRVIDNGSADGTEEAACEAGAEVVREARRGYGAAAWRGLQDWPGSMRWVLFSSADGSDRLSAEELLSWLGAVDAGADLVVGNRMAFAEGRRHLTMAQRLGNRLTCWAMARGWGCHFRDIGSLRLVEREALLQLGLTDRGFGWNVEMQVRAVERGWRIVELPVGYYPRVAGVSKISGSVGGTWRAGSGMLRMLAWLWRLHRQKGAASASWALGRSQS